LRKNKRLEIKEKLQRTASFHTNDKQKLARIIDSDDEDFVHDDKWLQTKEELAYQLQKLLGMLNDRGQTVTKELLGIGVPTRHRTYILGCCRQWMSEEEYKQKRPKFSN